MTAAPARVSLIGTGVSIATAAHLLSLDGFALAMAGEAAAPAPVVMLSEAALALMRDVFGRAALFAGRTPILRRSVAWGGRSATVPHRACVVTGADLASELADGLPKPEPARAVDAHRPAFFTLHAGHALPCPGSRRFGSREAMAAAVTLAPNSDIAACHIEATAAGWLFLIPHGPGQAWLLSVGGAPDALLGSSRLVAAQVGTLAPVAARFETAPHLLDTLAGDDWLAIGSAAIGFDPICGDGTAHAVREAILAAAVIAGVRDGGDRAALIGHYRAMLIAAMRRHLQVSLPFYQGGGDGPWWREQADAIAAGHNWCTAQLAILPEPQFVLQGTRLVPRALAA